MTSINCSSNCIYQKDGICSYHMIQNTSYSTSQNECAYFQEKNK